MRRRVWTGWAVGLLVVVALLWVGYWFAARYAAETALSRYASGGRTGIECTSPSVAGFPLKLDLRCARLAFASPDGEINAALGGIAATAPLYAPGRVAATIDAPLVANAPARGIALTASWSLATAEASAWLGGLTGLEVSFNSLSAENQGGAADTRLAGLTAATAHGSIAPAGGGAFALAGDATRLAVTLVDGRTLPEIDGEARVTLFDVGDALGTDPAETLLAWLRGGGTARLDRLKVAGEDALVTADGTLALSPDGVLDGNLLVRWNDMEKLLVLLERLVPGIRAKVEEPVPSLGIRPIDVVNTMTSAVDTPDGQLRQTAIVIRKGFVMLGVLPLPLDPIPPIRF